MVGCSNKKVVRATAAQAVEYVSLTASN